MKRRISLVMILALLTLAMIFAISCDKPAEPPTDEENWDEIMKNMDMAFRVVLLRYVIFLLNQQYNHE